MSWQHSPHSDTSQGPPVLCKNPDKGCQASSKCGVAEARSGLHSVRSCSANCKHTFREARAREPRCRDCLCAPQALIKAHDASPL
jgi:hypothetical protein